MSSLFEQSRSLRTALRRRPLRGYRLTVVEHRLLTSARFLATQCRLASLRLVLFWCSL